MGESERFREYGHIKFRKRFSVFGDGNAVMALFAINALAFVTLFFFQIGFYYAGYKDDSFNNAVIDWIQLPGNLRLFSEKPWTLLTYMISDGSPFLMRIISNMLWLWAFGYILQDIGGNDKVIPVYIYGGLAGAVFFITAGMSLPGTSYTNGYPSLLGANTSVMAVATATTALAPDYRFFRHIRNGIPLWILLLVYIFIDMVGVSVKPAPYFLAHIGGAVAGFVFVLALRKGYDGSLWMIRLYRYINNLFSPGKGKSTIKKTSFYETAGREPFQKTANVTRQRVDEILDKINQRGYSFLTEEEKEILRKAANEDF